MEVKTCPNPECTCVNPQPISNFANNKKSKDGVSHFCKVCNHRDRQYRTKIKKDFQEMTNQEKSTTIACMYINRRLVKNISKFYGLSEKCIVDVLKYEEIYEYSTCTNCNKLKLRTDFTDHGENKVHSRCKMCNVEKLKVFVSFNSYYPKLYKYEQIRDDGNGLLEVKCNYCGAWYKPNRSQITNRLNAINGNQNCNEENRLYCSDGCKSVCPAFNKSADNLMKIDAFNIGLIKPQDLAREVQPELRQMVFARDGYTCLKCKTHQNNLCVGLHCHHIEGVRWAPLESADINNCMTVCRSCHVAIHKQPGCSYNDMKCNVEDMEVVQKK